MSILYYSFIDYKIKKIMCDAFSVYNIIDPFATF